MAHRLYDPRTRQHALELYVSGGKTLAQIATEVGIPAGTLRTWHHAESYVRIRKKLRDEIRDAWLQEAKSVLSQDGLRMIHESFEASNRLRARIDEMAATQKLDPKQIWTLARALGACMDVVETFFKRTDTKAQEPAKKPFVVPLTFTRA